MELNWSTFVLEIINFLVLVWILKRFLYKPVLAVIARRQADIEKTLADARVLHEDAESLQEQYAGRLGEWDRERQQARAALAREIGEERTRRLAELRAELEQEREKMRIAEKRRRSDTLRRLEETALEQGARFATRLLEQASGPETEVRLIDLAIDELARLPPERIASLRNSLGKAPGSVHVASAFPLPQAQRRRLESVLADLAGPATPLQFEHNSALLAGIHITIGAWVLDANLRDELRAFVALAHDE